MSNFITQRFRNLAPVSVPATDQGMPDAPYQLTVYGAAGARNYYAKDVDHIDDDTLVLTLEDGSTKVVRSSEYELTKRR